MSSGRPFSSRKRVTFLKSSSRGMPLSGFLISPSRFWVRAAMDSRRFCSSAETGASFGGAFSLGSVSFLNFGGIGGKDAGALKGG